MAGQGLKFRLAPLAGGFHKNPRMERKTVYGEWRSGRTRQEKRSAKRAKYLGIPLQTGVDGMPELFFYGIEAGVVGMKVADVARVCQDSNEASFSGYDKVTPPSHLSFEVILPVLATSGCYGLRLLFNEREYIWYLMVILALF